MLFYLLDTPLYLSPQLPLHFSLNEYVLLHLFYSNPFPSMICTPPSNTSSPTFLHYVIFLLTNFISHTFFSPTPMSAGPTTQERTRIFPTRQEGSFSRITCVALTDDFLYYGTEAGTVEVFFIGEFVLLAGTVLFLVLVFFWNCDLNLYLFI